MSKTVVSIIIPVYNAESYVAKCLGSIIAQMPLLPENTVEVICVDDGSKDRSLSILNKYAVDYEYIKAIHQENTGPAAARNAGLDIACGEWVWFVDSDDYVAEDALEAIFASLQGLSADICLFDAYEHRGGRISNWEHFDKAFDTFDSSIIQSIQREVLYSTKTLIAAPWDKVYRRRFLAENGLRFNESLRVLDDMFFNMKVFGVAERVVYSKKKIYHYIRNTESITASYTPDRIEKDRVVWKAISEYLRSCKQYYGMDESEPESVQMCACAGSVRNDEMRSLQYAMYKRIVKSFAIALKLSIFNPNNPNETKDQLLEVGRVLKLPEYKAAFGSVRIRDVEWRLCPVIICVKIGWIRGLHLLTKMQEAL